MRVSAGYDNFKNSEYCHNRPKDCEFFPTEEQAVEHAGASNQNVNTILSVTKEVCDEPCSCLA